MNNMLGKHVGSQENALLHSIVLEPLAKKDREKEQQNPDLLESRRTQGRNEDKLYR